MRNLAGLETPDFMRVVIKDLFPGRIALVSSFGADSAVLLHMVAQIDKATAGFVHRHAAFCSRKHSPIGTKLVAHLGLTNVIDLAPKPAVLAAEDPENFLWASNPDRCCEIRKVLPLAEALEGYDAWITGRKRFQGQYAGGLGLVRIRRRPHQSQSARPLAGGQGDRTISMPSACRAIRSSPKTICRLGASLAPRRSSLAKTRARGAGAAVAKSNAGFIRCRFTPARTFDDGDIQS